MTFIRQDLKKHFVMAIKSNRTVAERIHVTALKPAMCELHLLKIA